MKVSITITVDLDEQTREAWDLNFGTGTDAAAIRRDVKTYLGNMVQQGAEVIGSENITWR